MEFRSRSFCEYLSQFLAPRLTAVDGAGGVFEGLGNRRFQNNRRRDRVPLLQVSHLPGIQGGSRS